MASPLTIQPCVRDTFLDVNNTAYNWGVSTILSFSGPHTVLIAWDDLSGIPAGATVTSAVMSIYSYGGALTSTLSLFRVLRSWVEGTKNSATAAAGEPTWTYYSYNTGSWTTAGCKGANNDHATNASATVATDNTAKWLDFSAAGVVADVQGWINADFSNNGWCIYRTVGNGYPACRSSEYTTDTTLCPKLYIEYTTPFITGINIGDVVKAIDWTGSKINVGDAWKATRTVKVNIADAWKRVYSSPAVLNEDATYILLESGTDDRIEVE
jgi:hypothetical protein